VLVQIALQESGELAIINNDSVDKQNRGLIGVKPASRLQASSFSESDGFIWC